MFEFVVMDSPPREPPAIVSQWNGEPRDIDLACMNTVSKHYRIPKIFLAAYLKTENGRVGQITPNSWHPNGKPRNFDMGPMQYNTINIPRALKMGITPNQIVWDGCANLAVGADYIRWLLNLEKPRTRNQLANTFAAYNSFTPEIRAEYRAKWVENLNQIFKTTMQKKQLAAR